MNLTIGVFCGSKLGLEEKYSHLVKEFVDFVKINNFKIVFGGTELGLMKILFTECIKKSVDIYGIVPKYLLNFCNKEFKNIIVTDNIEKRKNEFYHRSDFFVALPGGIGTLNEILDFMVKKELGESSKRIFLVNYDNFWNPFQDLLKHFVRKKFLKRNNTVDLLTVKNFEQTKKLIEELYVKNTD